MTVRPIESVDDLLARAYAMEVEAAERYQEFAGQMERHNNLEVAALFHRLAGYEQKHADSIAVDLKTRGVDLRTAVALSNPHEEGIETPPPESLHYLMTPFHALEIALASEVRAVDFFSGLLGSTTDPAVRGVAQEFAREETEHVELIRAWLAKVEKPSADWAEDPDEPRMPD
jgi:rubrerythrin